MKQQLVTVSQNCHICLKEDKHYYSVPYQHIGKKVKVLYNRTDIYVYYRYTLIATHYRNKSLYRYTTNPDHLASNHRFVSEWNPDRFINQATDIAEPVKELIEKILERAQHPEQAYKSCLGVLSYEKRVGRTRLVKACQRALDYESYNYGTVKNILERGLDKIDRTTDLFTPATPDHSNIRGEQYYS